MESKNPANLFSAMLFQGISTRMSRSICEGLAVTAFVTKASPRDRSTHTPSRARYSSWRRASLSAAILWLLALHAHRLLRVVLDWHSGKPIVAVLSFPVNNAKELALQRESYGAGLAFVDFDLVNRANRSDL